MQQKKILWRRKIKQKRNKPMSDSFIEKDLEDIIYGILFVAGEGVDTNYIAEKLEVDLKRVKKAVDKLEERLSKESGVHLIRYNTKVQLCSNPDYAEYISTVLNPIRERALTKATLETLAIIAYKQPVTRLEIEDVRGVNSDYTVQTLLDHNLIEVVGRKDAVGKPLLFGTTEEFLKRFGLTDIADLPDSEALMERIKTLYAENETSTELFNNYEIKEVEETFERRDMKREELSIEEIDSKIKKAMENANFKIPDKEEIPDFLKNEDVDIVS